MNEKISIVIACYNNGKTIEHCLKSILRQNKVDLEVIVVNDGSSDNSTRIIRKYPVKLINLNHMGVGYAKAMGAKMARGQIIAFLDADCIVTDSFLEKISKFPEGVGCIGGLVRAWNKEYTIAQAIECMQNEVNRRWPFGACVAYRREAYLKAGGVDPKLRFGEDLDLFYKMLEAGYTYRLYKETWAYTISPRSLMQFIRQRIKWGRGYAKNVFRHPQIMSKRNKICLTLHAIQLISLVAAPLNPYTLIIALAVLVRDLIKFTSFSLKMARKMGNKKLLIVIPILRIINAWAYLLSLIYESLIWIIRRE